MTFSELDIGDWYTINEDNTIYMKLSKYRYLILSSSNIFRIGEIYYLETKDFDVSFCSRFSIPRSNFGLYFFEGLNFFVYCQTINKYCCFYSALSDNCYYNTGEHLVSFTTLPLDDNIVCIYDEAKEIKL